MAFWINKDSEFRLSKKKKKLLRECTSNILAFFIFEYNDFQGAQQIYLGRREKYTNEFMDIGFISNIEDV